MDDDFDEGAFEATYLNSGIDLKANDSNNKQQETILDEILLETPKPNSSRLDQDSSLASTSGIETTPRLESNDIHPLPSVRAELIYDTVTSDLTKLAIQHLDRNQWQLPLLEMDKKFRDKTYYKHYTDTYISSLRSKLGHFLSDNKLVTNPMKYHLCQEKDNYSRHSRMFELLTEYYQSLGGGFFTFATPSPDEEIVIGCRLGTKGYYLKILISKLSHFNSCSLVSVVAHSFRILSKSYYTSNQYILTLS